MAWATADQVLLWTNVAVTSDELDRASAVIELYAGRVEEQPEDSITATDRRWLAQATAYQAVWMRGKPGLLEHRESHTSSAADGTSSTRESDSQLMLAPLAARCLRNLSWVGTRTVDQTPRGPVKGTFIQERGDEWHHWDPVDIS